MVFPLRLMAAGSGLAIAELGEEAAEFLADVTPTKSPLNCSLPN